MMGGSQRSKSGNVRSWSGGYIGVTEATHVDMGTITIMKCILSYDTIVTMAAGLIVTMNA